MQVILVPLTWKSSSHLREDWQWSCSSSPVDAQMLRAWASTGPGQRGQRRYPKPAAPQCPVVSQCPAAYQCAGPSLWLYRDSRLGHRRGLQQQPPPGTPNRPPLPRVLLCQSSTTTYTAAGRAHPASGSPARPLPPRVTPWDAKPGRR